LRSLLRAPTLQARTEPPFTTRRSGARVVEKAINGEKRMDLAKLSKRVTQELDSALADDLPAEERDAIVKIVQQAMLDAADRTHKACKEAAVVCCGPEADLAHKIQEQMDKKRDMLIANLMAMR
jgi:hypothetical protein